MQEPLRPTNLKEVRELLYDVRRKWYDIGIELELDHEELDNIKAAHPQELLNCLNEMIKKWLKSTKPQARWKALEAALRAAPVGEVKIANKGICRLATFINGYSF